MAVRPEPRLLHGELSLEDVDVVSPWISANADALIGYWDGELSTLEFGGGRLKRV
jgi:hypothetical protein